MAISTPIYLAATTGSTSNSGQINQFLVAHTAQIISGLGVVQASQTTGSSVYQSTVGQWISQSFTTGVSQTGISQILLQISDVGGSPTLPLIPVLTVSLYADGGGLPTGSALASATVSNEYVYSSGFWVTIPLAVSGLTSSTVYHLVTAPVGTSGHYYTWQQSNQVAGAAISVDGISWTASSYGMMYQVYDNSGTNPYPTMIYEDNGNRWTQFTYNAQGLVTQITEFTAGQTPTSYLYGTRTLTYTNGLLTGVN